MSRCFNLIRAIATGATLGAALAASQTAQAAACLYRGTDASARVVNASGVMFTPFPGSLSDRACERLRVVSGEVTVYALSSARGELRSTRLTRGPLVSGAAGGSDPEVTGFFAVIQAVLEGGQRMVKGSSRTDQDYIQAAMPSGRLAEPSADLRIPLSPAVDPNLKAVELSVGGKVIYRQTTPAAEIVLPAAQLTKGRTVAWRVLYGPSTLSGQVEVVERARLTALRDSVMERSAGERDPLLSQLRVAAALTAEGFSWDAQQVLGAALTR